MAEEDQEWREEAERLALLPRELQKQAIALIRAPANDPEVNDLDRENARLHADGLERLLRVINRRKKP